MKKTLFLLLAACAVSTASAEQYWVKGVKQSGGWFDTNKTGNNDSGFCWAAVDTNIISWWQSRNPAAAKEAAKNSAPQTQQDIWELYNNSFVNASGHPADGIKWYLNGTKPQTALKDTTTGAYYKDLDVTADIVTRSIYDYDPAWTYDNYESAWVKTGTSDPLRDTYLLLANDLKEYITNGYAIALGMAGYANYASYKHAVTLWGIETSEETGHLTKLWLTDSDDALYTLGDGTPKYPEGLLCVDCTDDWMAFFPAINDRINCYMVQSTEPGPNGDLWYQTKNNDYFYEFTAIKLTSNIVPEPTTATLSLLALAGLAARRRRK